jgi:hypothetical protein
VLDEDIILKEKPEGMTKIIKGRNQKRRAGYFGQRDSGADAHAKPLNQNGRPSTDL